MWQPAAVSGRICEKEEPVAKFATIPDSASEGGCTLFEQVK